MLNEKARDLVAAASKGAIGPVLNRAEVIDRLLRIVGEGRSVLLSGEDGVGKTAVVHGVALAMHARERGKLLQLSAQDFLVGTKGYIGQWQTQTQQMMEDAKRDGVVLYITDGWNLLSVGKTIGDASCVWDMIRPHVEARSVRLIVEIPAHTLKTLRRESHFVSCFDEITIEALPEAVTDDVLVAIAKQRAVDVDGASRARMIELSRRFSPQLPMPGPALRLLMQVADYHREKEKVGEPEAVSPAFVDKVFSIYSGLPRFVISREETRPVSEIRAWFQERIVGQAAAIDAVVETITLFKAGLNDPRKPLGTMLFVGPTGVGKTELARALAVYLFGSAQRMLRFDMSELKDYRAFELLLGRADDADYPARLIDPVRAQPFQVILLDELEKAHENIWDLMLQLLDEGRLTSARGDTADFRNTILIATSNVGARESGQSLGFGAGDRADLREKRIREALGTHFRPEFLNRFQHLAVFHPLSREQLRTIARQTVQRFLARDGFAGRNLVLDLDDAALDHAIDRGADPRFGARALERELQRRILVPVATLLMERDVAPGSILRASLQADRVVIRVLDTEASRTARDEQRPLVRGGRTLETDALPVEIDALAKRVEDLATSLPESKLQEELERLDMRRGDSELWSKPDDAAALLRACDRIRRTLDRLARLRARVADLRVRLGVAAQRTAKQQLVNQLDQLLSDTERAELELGRLGAGGELDALVEVRPLGAQGRAMRDRLHELLTKWLHFRRYEKVMLHEPLADDEPIAFAIRGAFAYGYLRLEAGVHRLREGQQASNAHVRVLPWREGHGQLELGEHRALKATGQLGGRIRSRLECPPYMVLQNDRTLAENRELAADLCASFTTEHGPDLIVRRYDEEPARIRDSLTGEARGGLPALRPETFHALLAERIRSSE